MSGPADDLRILSSFAQVEDIAVEWRTLHKRVARDDYGNYEDFEIWWKNFGREARCRLHVVTARTSSGELKALLPLVIRHCRLLRVLEWAGGYFFDYGDALAENEDDAGALWRFVRAQGGYDIASVKDMRSQSLSFPSLEASMRLRQRHKNYFLKLDYSSGDEWLASKPRAFRKEIRRTMKNLRAQGDVAFRVHRNGDEFPEAVIHALYEQKKNWFAARFGKGVSLLDEMKSFLLDLAGSAARKGTLYLAWLSCGEVLVAVHLGFIHNGVLHLYMTSFDRAYGVHSPGNMMLVETIGRAIGGRLRELDFMRGDEGYKRKFSDDIRWLSNFIAGRSIIGNAACRLSSLPKYARLMRRSILPALGDEETPEHQPKS